jgi:hypothetical protein
VRNEEVLLRVKEQRNILHEIRKRKANWTGHILRRNCFLQRVIEGKIKGGIEVTLVYIKLSVVYIKISVVYIKISVVYIKISVVYNKNFCSLY